MPKTARNLWERVVSWDNLLLAAKEASRSKRYVNEVMQFNANLEENLLHIQKTLNDGTWRPGPYRKFEVFEPKRRMVHAPCFADRVVHHALVQVIGPYFEKRFIGYSFACRIGKGTHAASKYLTTMLRSAQSMWGKNVFVLKADVSKYFYSIDHDVLLKIVARIIGDKRVLRVLASLVRENDCLDGDKGLPLGALTSQLMANAYLDVLDHYIKDGLGVRHYIRYMDDFVVLHNSKAILWNMLARIRIFLTEKLGLILNRKTGVFPASHGVDFAGYRHWVNYKLPRKRNMQRAKKRFAGLSRCYAACRVSLDIVRSCVASFVGYVKHCKGWRSAASTFERLVLIKSRDALPLELCTA